MSNKNIIPAVIFVLILLMSCDSNNSDVNNKSNNKYFVEYAGGYTIEIIGYSSNDEAELYVLHLNGKAKWMLISNDRSGKAKIMSEKSGSWTADEGRMKITIQGNTGPIVEEYLLKNGKFVNTISEDRYLQRTR